MLKTILQKKLYLMYMYTSAFHFTQAFRGQLTSLSRLSYEATFALVPVSRTLAA